MKWKNLNKEKLDDFGILGTNDFGARIFDKYSLRWWAVDPLAEKREWLTPYNMASNNPMNRIDPDGALDETCCGGGATDDPFLFAKLAVTAFYDVKHAAYNSVLRLAGSDYRADYKIENGSEVFETQFTKQAPITNVSGALKEAGKAALDLMVIVPGASMEGKALAQTSKSQTARTANSVLETSSKATISETKNGLSQVYDKLGISKPLPKGESGKFGSPTAGDAKKGYRLDPAHPNRPKGDNESVPHINYWDWTSGKKGTGGNYGAIPLKNPN